MTILIGALLVKMKKVPRVQRKRMKSLNLIGASALFAALAIAQKPSYTLTDLGPAGNMFSAGAAATKAADCISRRRVILINHLLHASRRRVANRC